MRAWHPDGEQHGGPSRGAGRDNPREDFLSSIANTEMDDHKLEDSEIPALCRGFFFAGHHTTTAGLSSLFTQSRETRTFGIGSWQILL